MTWSIQWQHQIKLMRVLRDFADRGWGGVVAVLHDLAMVRHWADCCLLLDKGRQVGVGPPQEALSAQQIARIYQLDPADLAVMIPL